MIQRRKTSLTIGVAIIGALLVGFLVVPYAIASGSGGPFAKPNYQLLAAGMTKGNGLCYLTIVVRNTGNVNIDGVVALVNGTELWHTESVISPGTLVTPGTVYSTTTDGSFYPGGQTGPAAFFPCPSISVGSTLPFFIGVHFDNGQNENVTTSLLVGPNFPATYRLP